MPLEDAIRLYPQTRRFEVIRVLGTGGMGVVYEALDRERQSRVALKTLRTLNAEALLRFKREFRALQDIQHPNLVSLGELLEENGQIFFTMELVEGIDFIEYVRPRGLSDRISGLPRPTEETLASPGARTVAPPRPTMRPPVSQPGSSPPPRRSSSLPPRTTSPAPPRPSMRPVPEGNLDLPGSAIRDRRVPWNWLIRNGSTFDEERLRSAFAQLARGIQALHLAQKVHRDIKPSNVLVTEEGRVVLLDFGLVADVERDERDASVVVGTAHFMAPEQAAARDVGPEADWYSMGSMLYLALTGYYPFQLAPEVVLDFKQCVEPTPPGLLVEDLPRDLESLCIDLLHLDPKARPTGVEVLRRLNVEEARDEAPLSSYATAFIGRWSELEELDQALADARGGASVAVLIEGESGMGKSALLRRFLEQFSGDALVLSGRCYERESVPYKAVDEIIDALSDHLAKLPHAEVEDILPHNAGLLASIFPVLEKVPAFEDKPRDSSDAKDPLEIRTLVFTALRDIFARLAAARPVVLAIDDLQWADADGLALLTGLLRPPDPPPLLFVSTMRSEDYARRSDRSPRHIFGGAVRAIQLGPLPPDEARQLAKLLLRTAGPRRAAGEGDAPPSNVAIDLDAIIDEAAGHPLFIDALVRHRLARADEPSPVRLDDALWERIQRLDALALRLLELVAVAGGPVRKVVASHALTADLDELTRLAGVLRISNLVRTSGAGRADVIETFHDRIRETVVSRIDEGAARAWHGRLAFALEATGSGELERLAVHWEGAGEPAHALGYTIRAADQAASALAFDRAAKLYRAAIRLSTKGASGKDDLDLYKKLADALANAGRSSEAADIYARASALAPADEDESLDLKRLAAENYLRCGYVDEGMACLREVLTAIDMEVPETPAATMSALVFRRNELRMRGLRFEERSTGDLSMRRLALIDLCWSAALGLGMVDHVRGAYFQTRNLLLSLKAGEPSRVARALGLEATFTATAGASARARVAELLAAARKAAERSSDPHTLGLVPAFSGLSAFFEGRFPDALGLLDKGEAILRERCSNVAWERATALSYAAFCLWFLGDLGALARRVPQHLREAEERGDRYFATHLRSGFSNAVWLIQDDPDEAQRQAEEAIRDWSRAGFHLQHFYDMVARAQISLYRGEAEDAHRYVMDRWAALEASMHLRIQVVRVNALHLKARTALALAKGSPERGALLELCASAAREVEGEDAAWAEPLSAMVRAGIAASRGDTEGAHTWLAKAQRGFRSAHMELFAAVAKLRLGELLGHDQGEAMVTAADRWLRERGVVRPDRLTAMLAPGF